ncbi:hypothetical protein IGS68_28820 (plasmid) [Skermanella sp. TT6]|uniref:WxL domain-containing protein n=1 Tax=Skermanella cutis TaxID=2775420 RepID=A0ABX7BFI3_9PROT|nr:hypothetical protein [Skermanella sp. TT6]QQP93148.1 hypothetical protein IGS68_28820 [Skermanella sp. TT6]
MISKDLKNKLVLCGVVPVLLLGNIGSTHAEGALVPPAVDLDIYTPTALDSTSKDPEKDTFGYDMRGIIQPGSPPTPGQGLDAEGTELAIVTPQPE